MNRLIGPLLALLLMLGSVLADEARARIWAAYTGYQSPYVTALPPGEPTQPRTRKLIVLVVRGLRMSASEQMPALNALRERGASVALELDAPTYQVPVWLTLFSGARAETHGTATNSSPRSPELDSVFARMAALGQNSVLIGSSTWNDLFGAAVQRAEVIEAGDAAQQDALAMDALLQTLRDPNAPERLIVTELALLNATARADPDGYALAAAATDIRIKTVRDAADLANNTLVVLSDRGLTTTGGDGGTEPDVARVPLVLAGAGVRAGTQAIAKPIDVAPTLAVLLGVPIPAQAQGAPVWDAIDSTAFLASARQLTAFYEGWAESARLPRFAAELTRQYDADLAAGQRARFDVWYATLTQAAADARNAKLAETQTDRLPLMLGMLLFLLAAGGVVLNNRALPALIGAGVFAVGWVIDFYFVRGLSPSLSLFREGDPAAALALVARDCALLYALGCVAASIAAALLCETLSDAITAVTGALVLIVIVCAAQFLWFYWNWGETFTWGLPDGGAVAAVSIALAQLAALNVSISSALPSLPIPLAAIVVAVIARGLLGSRAQQSW